MDGQVLVHVKMHLHGGWATPAPPVGPALAPYGVNIGEFCTRFNRQTKDLREKRLPVVVTVFKGGSFTFVVRQPTVTSLLKEAAGIVKGSGEPNKVKAGSITQAQLMEIAAVKMPDLNARNLEAAAKTVAGTARSMGIEIVP